MRAFFRSIFCYGIWLCLLALLSLHHSGYAQTSPNQSAFPSGGLIGGRGSGGPTGEAFFEGPVNPDDYIVGPGDRLDVVFWQPNFIEYPMSVNAEGEVIIPYVGAVTVANLTLREVHSRIEEAVSSSMRIAKVTVALIEPRHFRVNVTGLVELPGTYIVPATARVADAVGMAGGFRHVMTFVGGDTSITTDGSQRRIELRGMDGHNIGHADLLLFQQGGRLKGNPRLQDGMTIHVPYKQGVRQQVGVFGAVHSSGLFESADSDNLGDALALAGGMASDADSSNVTVVGDDGVRVTLDLHGASLGTSLAHSITPGSRVYVSGSADTSHVGSVTLVGEVAHPGGYPIVTGHTTLREVLDRAGGLLPTAASNSARLIRKARRDPVEPERIRVLEASLMNNPRYSGRDAELAVEFAKWDRGSVVLDLSGADKSNSAESVTLQDGDMLEVPKNPLGVRVLGAVNHGGEVAWAAGKNLNYYLSEAGGVNVSGWKRRAVLLKARNGSQLQYQSSLPIDPGDVIYVPPGPQLTTWDVFKDFLGVTAQVATVVLIVQNLKK